MISLRLARTFLTGFALGVALEYVSRWLREREGSHAQAVFAKIMNTENA